MFSTNEYYCISHSDGLSKLDMTLKTTKVLFHLQAFYPMNNCCSSNSTYFLLKDNIETTFMGKNKTTLNV